MNYFVLYTIGVLFLSILMGLSTWKLFKKMGYSPFLAFIPFYNYFIILKETQRPLWWVIFTYFPIVGTIMMSVFHILLMEKFGKNLIQHKLLTIFLPFIYMATVNYSKNTELDDTAEIEYYTNTDAEVTPKKESLIGSLTFAAVFATIVHVFITQPFTIPTGSMERTLMVGDFMFVDKLSYGYRMPMRPIAIPFLQGTIMDTGVKGNPKDDPKSYIDAVQLPYFRFPGWSKPEKNDIVVFNYPQDSVHNAIDRKDPYVKRLVAVGGDTVEMRAGRLFINGKPENRLGDAEVEYSYILQTSSEIDINSLFEAYGALSIEHIVLGKSRDFTNEYFQQYNIKPNSTAYRLQATEKIANELKELPEFLSITEEVKPKGVANVLYFDQNQTRAFLPYSIFPYTSDWNEDWYGPLTIPKKGDVITLTKENFPIYQKLIAEYEGNTLEEKEGKYYINGNETNQYTVKLDYYFMMGDNRDQSLDARFFGFVPETHIVGKPMFTWMSIQGLFSDQGADYQAPFKIRWDRMFKATNTGDMNKTSYWWLAAIVLILFFGWDSIMKIIKKKKED